MTMTTAVVVMESGSQWPGQIGDSMNVVALGPGGEDHLRSTRDTLDALQRSRQGVQVAVLACNPEADATAVGRRAEVAHVLLDALDDSDGGSLILTARDSARQQLRDQLLALADTLVERIRGTGSTVSLRFSGDAPLRG